MKFYLKGETTFRKLSLNNYFTYKNFLIKVGLSPSKRICVICLIESPLKMLKNYFYFVLKALSVFKNSSFCHDFLVKINDVTTWFTNNCNTHIA